MGNPVFIGDELTATAFRLGGAEIHVAEYEDPERVFTKAVAGNEPVLIAANCARLLKPELLNAALRAARPPVAIVPDALGEHPPDITSYVRRTLDLE